VSVPSASIAIRALVADDDPLMAGLLTAFLARRGYEVEHCDDGEAALQRVREARFNLVVTDRIMPRMDGLQLCRAIRALAPAGEVYCILLTASADPADAHAAMDAGADDFIAKPLRLPDLARRLDAAERTLATRSGAL